MKIGDCTSIAIGGTQVSKAYVGSTLVWPTSPTPPQRDYSKKYLTFEIVSGGTLGFRSQITEEEATEFTKTIFYSLDRGSTWEDWECTSMGAYISVNAGDKVLVQGYNCAYNEQYLGYSFFDGTAYFNLYGNINSLLYGDSFTGTTGLAAAYTFANLFSGSKVISAENLVLPATEITFECYRSMFAGCNSLTDAPKILPATALTEGCYEYMFQNCISLVNVPSLPATTLSDICYAAMFYGCTSLVNAPALPATTLAEGCYQSMFASCTHLNNAPALPATALTEGCYESMFYNCTSLETAPELPATLLAQYSYYNMFLSCTNLNYIKCLATSFAANSTTFWVSGVSATGTFVKDPTATWSTGNSGIPSGWTVEDNE